MSVKNENFNYISLVNELLLFKSLLAWRNQPDKSLRMIIKQICRDEMHLYNNSLDSKQLLSISIACTISNLLRQNFVSCYDFLRRNIDDKMTVKIKNLRDSISTKKTNINSVKLLDVIRQAFAHNDIKIENPNWTLNENFHIEMNFKGNNFIFDFIELHDLLFEFIQLKKESSYLTFKLKHGNLLRAFKSNKITPDNIGSFITFYDDNNNEISLDKYQKLTLYNLIYSNESFNPEERINQITNSNYYIISQCLPLKRNAGAIVRLNNMGIRQLMWLDKNFMSKDVFLDACDMCEQQIHLVNADAWHYSARQQYSQFVHEDSFLFESSILNNIMFNIFSMIKIDEVSTYFEDLDIDVKRLRNSYMHGRYHYNHNMGFNFYDGLDNDKLKYIGTLHINDMLKVISNFMAFNKKNIFEITK